jgi:hypothetical protein
LERGGGVTYNKSDKFYSKLSGACACMGVMYGEPHCACEMSEKGLPMSVEHVEAVERFKEEMWKVVFREPSR